MERSQSFSFGFADSLLAKLAGVSPKALHFDVDAICRACEKIAPVAERLGAPPPRPHIAGFCYPHLASLGAEIVFEEDGEPNVVPMIRCPEDIDRLREPDDYLAAEVIQQRLRLLRELKKRRPDAVDTIGHPLEGPITTAALLMGSAFFMLPYDDPDRAHRLLDFCVRSALHYAHVIAQEFGTPVRPGGKGMPDDFAGMFRPDLFEEFVVPYWNQVYEGLQATSRHVHSELLRVEHLPLLPRVKIDVFDPSADQYLTPELLRQHCPVKFQSSILSWHVRDLSAQELQARYREIAECEPVVISFSLDSPTAEPKIRALLDVAREMKAN